GAVFRWKRRADRHDRALVDMDVYPPRVTCHVRAADEQAHGTPIAGARGGRTGWRAPSTRTSHPPSARATSASGNAPDGAAMHALTSAIATSRRTPPPRTSARATPTAAQSPVRGSAIAAPQNTGAPAASHATSP